MSILSSEENSKILDMYTNGINIDDIIKQLGVQEKEVRVVLKENSADRKYNTFSIELYDRIVELYKKGNTQDYICEQLLISPTCIVKTLKKRGEHVRTFSENNRKYSLNETYFDNIDTSNKAYILGLLYADGCNHVKHNAVTISLQECDKEILEFVKNELEYEGPLRINKLSEKNSNYKDQYMLSINNEHISRKLEELGVVNAKSLILKFPEWLDESLYSAFVRGYFDGDGCVSYDEKRQKCYTKIAGTWEFCNKLSMILNDLSCKHNIVHPKQSKNSNTFILQTCGNKSSLTLLSWIYDDAKVYIERKYQKYLYVKEKYTIKMSA